VWDASISACFELFDPWRIARRPFLRQPFLRIMASPECVLFSAATYPMSASESLPVGFELGRFRVKSMLGQGAFGITYQCSDSSTQRDVAIKEYFPSQFADRESTGDVMARDDDEDDLFHWGLQRFKEEAETLATLRHRNIVRVHAVFTAFSTAYMVMAFEEGQELGKALKAGRLCDEDEILEFLRQMMNALQRVHDLGFIHRDVKPSNILLRADGTPVLIDFGSARRAMGEKTLPMTALVSPGYAPFEQYDSTGAMQGPWTDVYALAAVTSKIVTGSTPPDAMQRIVAVMNNLVDPLDVAGQAQGRYSRRLIRAIEAGAAVNVEDRPQTVNDWREQLNLTLGSASIKSRRPLAAVAATESDGEDPHDELKREQFEDALGLGEARRRFSFRLSPRDRRRLRRHPATKIIIGLICLFVAVKLSVML
jgi:serine/threonine protein kinase